MKTLFTLIITISIILIGSNSGKAQAQDTIPQKEISHFSKWLNIDDIKAEKVSRIQSAYKSAIKKLVADTVLTEEEKHLKVVGLISEKNRQLENLLDKNQQQKIIPTTERIPPALPTDHIKTLKP
ncbi:hypothetical protein FBD94_14745 [Pedobacter hiemivivus]|uniref:Uncharacterized protein n=1 Tax=Pedobacter hiemivivus TaxID=2530454 RepID=A0A4U1GB86_9SPHI|nr:hypothetical protein [Pedobacter hiemivivus]TKC60169.1 hypothetical protein FBD94_14745 [Pedobacter hiemivivus]